MMHVATRSALILAFVLVSLEPPLAHADCVRNEEFDQISAVVTEGFYDRTFRGLDWPQRVAHARAGIDCNGDERALARVVNELLGELHASHTDLYTREDPGTGHCIRFSPARSLILQFPFSASGPNDVTIAGLRSTCSMRRLLSSRVFAPAMSSYA